LTTTADHPSAGRQYRIEKATNKKEEEQAQENTEWYNFMVVVEWARDW